VDKGKERGDQSRPSNDRDVGFREDLSIFQPLVDAVQEDAAQGKKKRDADETGRQNEDLPTLDVRIPGYGYDKVVQPQL